MKNYLLLTLLLILPNIATSQYLCQVNNCEACSYYNRCGRCSKNYILKISQDYYDVEPYCAPVYCPDKNCAYCLGDNVCEQCLDGFHISQFGQCISGNPSIKCSENCLNCTSRSQCTLCSYGYNLQNSKCVYNITPLTRNCKVAFSSYKCQICITTSLIVGTFYTCTYYPGFNCQVENCFKCQSDGYCKECFSGYTLNNGTCQLLECQVANCLTCQDEANCGQCQDNYYYSSKTNTCLYKSYGCNMTGCLICDGIYNCAVCQQGYFRHRYSSYTGSYYSSFSPYSCFPVSDLAEFEKCQKFGYISQLFYKPNDGVRVGCIECKKGFISIDGICVANLKVKSYICQVQNCVYCISYNYCGRCQEGYTIFQHAAGLCLPISPSGISNCLLFKEGICYICEQGYYHRKGLQCQRQVKNVSCRIDGCQYCLEDNVCFACAKGYRQSSLDRRLLTEDNENNAMNSGKSCVKICSLENCLECKSQNTCNLCEGGYKPQNVHQVCSDPSSSICRRLYGAQCIKCHDLYCTQCSSGFQLDYTRKCCPTSGKNMLGCLKYSQKSSYCKFLCVQCEKGFILIDSICYSIPCHLENCNYCFRSDICSVCSEGYHLNAKTNKCELYQQNNCPQNCISCSNQVCTECLNGYLLHEGNCVCKFQNCLECLGDKVCTHCASPTISTMFTNDGGCIPAISPGSICEIKNCFQCISDNKCGYCDPGFMLTLNGTCIQNNCTEIQNCELCPYNQNFCFLCKPGYIPSMILGSKCEQAPSDYQCLVSGCAICQSSTSCQACHATFTLTSSKTCQPSICVQNCMICISNNTCLACEPGHYMSTDLECILFPNTDNNTCELDNCLYCIEQSQSQTNETLVQKCQACVLGFYPSDDMESCIPQNCMVPNCAICLPGSDISQNLCLLCSQGFFLNPYFQCIQHSSDIQTVKCDIYNCLYCYQENKCGICVNQWMPINGLCQTTKFCNALNCQTCSTTMNCTQCQSDYVLTNPKFNNEDTNNYFCSPKCDLKGCQVCQSASICSICTQTYILTSSGKCDCPDDSYIVNEEDLCVCPSNKKAVNGSSCVQCTIDRCIQCSEENKCKKCEQNFTLSEDNACFCPSTFQIIDKKCQCPSQTTLNQDQNICVSCGIQNCILCTQSDKCSKCRQSYTVQQNKCSCPANTSQFNNSCYVCNSSEVPYCIACSQNNYCQNCNKTFAQVHGRCQCSKGTTLYKSEQGAICISCDIQGCSFCKQPNVCQTCEESYNITDTNVCLYCPITNCLSCSADNFCSSCQGNLEVNNQGDKCVTCDIQNCEKCSITDICEICEEGFEFDLNQQFCVNCSQIKGCSICSGNGVCGVCATGYILSDGQCSFCSYPCSTCFDNGTCETCQQPFALQSDSQGKCYTCAVSNCNNCTSQEPQFCLDCLPGYQTLEDGTCQVICSTNLCLQCNDAICTNCVKGYSPHNNSCQPCQNAPLCISCEQNDRSICTECNDGYYMISGECQKCPEPSCAKCNSDGCIQYKSTTQQFPIKIGGQIKPAKCDPGCSKCSKNNPQICIICSKGYSKNLTSSLCTPCSPSCKTCKNDDPTSCLSCYDNAFLKDNVCQVCDQQSNCLTCNQNTPTICKSCSYGFKLTDANKCIKGCSLNCLSCDNSGCNLCVEGYSLNPDGQCLPCLANCRKCSGQANGVCLDCGTGFYLNSNQICVSCSQFCSSCTQLGCSECISGFTLTSSFNCAANCKTPCASCSSENPEKCFTCIAGYAYDASTSTCVPTFDCPGGVCVVCPLGYTLDFGKCQQCKGKNCARCPIEESTKCSSCFSGFYLNNTSQCAVCPEGCSSCTSNQSCSSCQSGFTLPLSPIEKPQLCIACESPCQACSSTPSTCTSCIQSYKLSGWKCISNFNYGFQIVLAVDPSVFYTNYFSFLNAIAQAMNASNSNIITLFVIQKGSTVVDGNLTTEAPPNSAESSSQLNSLNSLIKDGGEIAGMDVESGNVIANGEPDDDNNNNSNNNDNSSSGSTNLGLILGICIPLGILIIGVIIYCVYRSRSQQAEDAKDEQSVRQQFEMKQRSVV